VGDTELSATTVASIVEAADAGDRHRAATLLGNAFGREEPVDDVDLGEFLALVGGAALATRAEDISESLFEPAMAVRFDRATEWQLQNNRADPRLAGLLRPTARGAFDLGRDRGAAFTQDHQRILALAERFDADKLEFQPQTLGDTVAEGANLERAGRTRSEYAQHVLESLSPVIDDAAKEFDLPAGFLRAILAMEAGGDEFLKTTGLIEALNSFRNKGGNRTSLGLAGMQLRRGAETLGYTELGQGDSLEGPALSRVRASLNDPVQAIYILAKHMSDLRALAAPGVGAKELTAADAERIGALYSLGPPDPSREIDTPSEVDAYLSDAPHPLRYGQSMASLAERQGWTPAPPSTE
ncbi:MAG: hypothetical protein AAF658_20210, partial [Myxococcota bacterium]